MKVYTSYFAKYGKLVEAGIMPIGIALYPPKWFHGVSMKQVSPTWSILHEESHERYTERFKREVLSRVDAVQFMKQLRIFSNGKDVALCCFEKPGDFCHRHIVADWLKEKLGIEVEEWGCKPMKKPECVELNLFGD